MMSIWEWKNLRNIGVCVELRPVDWALWFEHGSDSLGGEIEIAFGPLRIAIGYGGSSW